MKFVKKKGELKKSMMEHRRRGKRNEEAEGIMNGAKKGGGVL